MDGLSYKCLAVSLFVAVFVDMLITCGSFLLSSHSASRQPWLRSFIWLLCGSGAFLYLGKAYEADQTTCFSLCSLVSLSLSYRLCLSVCLPLCVCCSFSLFSCVSISRSASASRFLCFPVSLFLVQPWIVLPCPGCPRYGLSTSRRKPLPPAVAYVTRWFMAG